MLPPRPLAEEASFECAGVAEAPHAKKRVAASLLAEHRTRSPNRRACRERYSTRRTARPICEGGGRSKGSESAAERSGDGIGQRLLGKRLGPLRVVGDLGSGAGGVAGDEDHWDRRLPADDADRFD